MILLLCFTIALSRSNVVVQPASASEPIDSNDTFSISKSRWTFRASIGNSFDCGSDIIASWADSMLSSLGTVTEIGLVVG